MNKVKITAHEYGSWGTLNTGQKRPSGVVLDHNIEKEFLALKAAGLDMYLTDDPRLIKAAELIKSRMG